MKIRLLFARSLFRVALALLACLLVWWLPREVDTASSALHEGGAQPSAEPLSAAGSVPRSPTRPQSTVAGPASSSPIAPPASGGYRELARHAVLVRQEARRFEAQKWEVDLAKALELPASVRLERRSGVYRVDGFKFPLVRVDRVYRMDRAGATTPVAPSQAGANVSAASPQPTVASAGTDPLEAGGGELVWENAMVADHLMVQAQPGVSEQQLQAALPRGTRVLGSVTQRGLYLVAAPADGERSVERAVLALNQLTGVIQFAEPDFLTSKADATPTDPLFGSNTSTQQWHLGKIRAPRAWDVVKGPKNTTIANSTVVAVVDTGVDHTHPDLAANMWINPGESGSGKETNNADDDASGKPDDWRGWNFVENNNDPMDDVGHGTHVAGIIGAAGNNATGGTGVCWSVKIVPLRIIKAVGNSAYGVYSDAIAAMDYIRRLNQVTHRVAVANHSWGGNGYSLAMFNEINNPLPSDDPLPVGITGTYATDVNQFTVAGSAAERAKIKVGMKASGTGIPIAGSTGGDTVVTILDGTTLTLSNYSTAAGNGAALTFSNPLRPKQYGVLHIAAAGNSRLNADRIPTYPATLPSGMMVSVGASDVNDAVALWAGTVGSNFGKLNVDLFAPGSSIWSTYWKPAAATPPTGYIAVPGSSTQGYVALNGTSMAAPQVTAAVALIRMWQPKLTDFQARQILVDQAEPIAGLKGKCISGGRLNIARMLDKIYTPVLLASGGGTSGSGTADTPLTGSTGISGLIASGLTWTLAVKEGKVFAWGENSTRQLGSATLTESATPIEVPGLDNVVMVGAGANTSYAIKTDGTVWAWGSNYNGLFGIGSYGNYDGSATPVQISTLSDIIWVSSTGRHTLAVRADGTVWAWGLNLSGQLGDGTTIERLTPVQVSGLTDIIMAEAGSNHSIALRKDGTVYCWGARGTTAYNPLGDGPVLEISKVPIQVPNLTDVSLVDAGNSTSLALLSDGTVWQWGFDLAPQSTVPVQRTGLVNIVQAVLGGQSGWAMDADGRLFGWGAGSRGQLGNASFSGDTRIAFKSGVASRGDQPIVALTGNDNNCFFRTLDGVVYGCGWNEHGRLGNGIAPTKYYPVMLPSLSGVSNLTFGRPRAGQAGGFAVYPSGKRLRWGDPVSYDDILTPEGVLTLATPKEMTFMPGATKIRMFPDLYLYTKSNGTLWGWGAGGNGQLGIGTAPGDVSVVNPVQIPVGGTVIDFSAATTGSFAAAVLSGGVLKMWGDNSFGQLGDGSNTQRRSPITVTSLTGVTNVSTGSGHTLALLADKTVWAWGANGNGQLGDGTTTSRNTPYQVAPGNLSNVVAIAAVGQASFAVRQDGTVWAWGERGEYPRLGFPSGTGDVTTPAQIPGLSAIKSISAGSRCVLAIANDNTVWAWGTPAQLGRGPISISAGIIPGQVVGLSNVVEVTAAWPACYARKSDGGVFAWGSSVGDGNDMSNVPVPVLGFAGASESLSSLGTFDITASWQFQNFSVPELLDNSLVADGADPDQDGISNLLEYALGLNPRQNDGSGLPTSRVDSISSSAQSESAGQIQLFSLTTVDLIAGKHYQALTVTRNGVRQDIDYTVEVSPNLQDWLSGDPFTITVLDTAETLEVYDAIAIEDAPQRFMRLRIRRK